MNIKLKQAIKSALFLGIGSMCIHQVALGAGTAKSEPFVISVSVTGGTVELTGTLLPVIFDAIQIHSGTQTTTTAQTKEVSSNIKISDSASGEQVKLKAVVGPDGNADSNSQYGSDGPYLESTKAGSTASIKFNLTFRSATRTTAVNFTTVALKTTGYNLQPSDLDVPLTIEANLPSGETVTLADGDSYQAAVKLIATTT